ncbi:MAG: hypothetical protein M1438_11190 [Deltaproteobacteria bacterium]|nr:hypothetical protein [Deltaproteobacteria bacterium]
MYKSASRFMQRTAIRSNSSKKKKVQGHFQPQHLANEIVQVCLDCGNPQLKKDVKKCHNCGGRVIDQFVKEFGYTEYKIVKLLRKEIYLFKNEYSNQVIKFTDFFLSIHSKKHNRLKRNNFKIIFGYVPTHNTVERVLKSNEVFSQLIIMKNIKNISLNLFKEIIKKW